MTSPGWLVIDGTPPAQLAADGLDGVVLLDTTEPAAAALAADLGLPVLAPGGPVVVSPGGTMFAAAGWWRHTPDGQRVAAGPRFPAPAWPDADLDATPIPAGWLLSAGPAPEITRSVAVDPARPLLVCDATVTGPGLAAALRALPEAADVAFLAPGQGAGRPVALAAAAELGEPVSLVNGIPLHTPSGEVVVYALDSALNPVWPEPAARLRCLPDGREEVAASTPPQPGLRALDAATYALELGWLVRVSGGGLHAMPVGPLAPAVGRAAVPAPEPAPAPAPAQESTADLTPYRQLADGRYRVVVGTPGLDINDLVWPALSTLFTAALTDVPAGVELEVIGEPTDWGRAAAAELAERHPGGDAAVKPYQVARVLALGAEPAAVAAPAPRRRLLLAAAGAAAVVALGAGVVAAWPERPAPAGTDAAGEPYPVPGGSGPSPAASGSRRPPSARPSSPAPRPSGSAPSAGPGGDTEGTSSSGGPDPLGLNGLLDLAAGRNTRDSGHADVYGSGNITDGDASTYWESRNNAFPQWVQVDLGNPAPVRRAVLRLPPSPAWPARSQRIEVQASADDKTFSTLVSAANYTFDPASGQRATIMLPGSQWRYVRLVFTANTVQGAGQLASLELYRL
ncbi:discoidin domain-containing protein [Dactylosporangium sp. CA-139114]|uniref:discoidin domain-containing protein n=1 Tax=Dactylosporangium sp. CA-139114 TaxID=3239931 RepID=UPI003D99BA4C